MNTLISIIVPVFNVFEYLERCVLSIRNQTYSSLEIILVDDGSTDGSEALCEKFAREDDRIKVVHKANGGATLARNAGLKVASGEYIGFVDSDDYIELDMYEVLISAIKREDADICVGRQFIDKNGVVYTEKERGIIEGVVLKDSGIIADNIIYSENMCNKGISPNLWDKIFKKDLILKHQLKINTETKYAEDDLCVYGCLLDANKVVFVNKALYHYCAREGSITRSGDDQYFSKINLFYTQMKEVFMKYDTSSELMNKLNHYMVELVIRGINGEGDLGFGNIIPYHLPPFSRLIERKSERIVLYGAGDVGRSYYRAIQIGNMFRIVLWVDIGWEYYSKMGYSVKSPYEIVCAEYDTILIAVDNLFLKEEIVTFLVDKLGVQYDIIIDDQPMKFVETF